jgi:hypothetical protein
MAKLRGNDPMLALVRDPLLSRVDRRLAAILGGSLALHIAIAAYAWSTDIEEPAPVATAAIPVEYQDIDIMIPDFTPPQKVTNGPGTATPATPNQTPKPIVRRQTIRPQITTGSQIDPNNLGGFFTDDGPSRRPTLDLAEQIREAREGKVEVGTQHQSDEHSPRIGTQQELPAIDDPSLTRTHRTNDDEPHGRVIPGTVKPETSSTLTPALVLQIIQNQYMRGLQRCYQRGLATEGTLSGKVALEFTVGENGQVTDHSAAGVSDSVEQCIDNQMSTWRFPAPHDAKGNAIDAPFTVTLALQPS